MVKFYQDAFQASAAGGSACGKGWIGVKGACRRAKGKGKASKTLTASQKMRAQALAEKVRESRGMKPRSEVNAENRAAKEWMQENKGKKRKKGPSTVGRKTGVEKRSLRRLAKGGRGLSTENMTRLAELRKRTNAADDIRQNLTNPDMPARKNRVATWAEARKESDPKMPAASKRKRKTSSKKKRKPANSAVSSKRLRWNQAANNDD